MPFELSNLKENNSDLVKLLTLHLPDMLWVKDLDGKYLYANKALCDGLLMAKDTQEPIGKGDLFFALRERELYKDKPDWHTFGELCFNSDQIVIDNDQAMKFEEYGNIKGKLLYLEVFKAPFYDKNGKTIGTVGSGRDITELKKIQLDLETSLEALDEKRNQLAYQASHDALTGLANRVLFMDRLTQSISSAQRNNKQIVVLFIDLDNFKEINDSLGHSVGDAVLVEVSKRMRAIVRKSDTLSRLGGDEFCVILNDIDGLEDVINIIDKGMIKLKEPLSIGNNVFYMGMSIGISIYPNDGDSATLLLKNADAAMYKAKDSGRGTYCFYDEVMTQKAYDRIFLESSMRSALNNDEFVVYYQPQMNAKEEKLVGMEALVRWQHPSLGLVSPNDFIPLAEDTGMIIELDRIVMSKSVSQLLKWIESGLNPGVLAINLAVKQLEKSDFIDFVKNLLGENSELLSKHIEFEVTENRIMHNPESSISVLNQLSGLGISIAIDDFGTGYSSLAYLKKLPLNKLKIDKSFIEDLCINKDDEVICKTIISLGNSLNLKVIAEGVERKDQKDFLIENGCSLIQGYFYARPMPEDEMQRFLKEQKSL